MSRTIQNIIDECPPWGAYSAGNFNSQTNTLIDLTGNGRHAICANVTLANNSGNGASASIPYIYGIYDPDTHLNGTVTWPVGSLPTGNFTICSISRYNNINPSQTYLGRIIQSGNNGNWLHGHLGEPGRCYYNGDASDGYSGLFAPNNWLVCCGKNATPPRTTNIILNGSNFGFTGFQGLQPFENSFLGINVGPYAYESSNWAFTYLFIWNSLLSDNDMIIVSNALMEYLETGILDISYLPTQIPPTIGSFSISPVCIGTAPFQIENPSSNSDGAFTYSSSDSLIASITNNNILNPLGIGTTTITANQAESGDYTEGSTSTTVTVTQNTSDNPVQISTGSQLQYSLSFGLSPLYIILNGNVNVNNPLIQNGVKYIYAADSNSKLIYSLPDVYIESVGNTSAGEYTVGEYIEKDMATDDYTLEFDPIDYPELFPNMAPFTSDNIVSGDKYESERLDSSYFDDWGNDIFDGWGFFYLYDVASEKYYFPIFDPINQDNGILTTQTFEAFGRVFTISHGFPVEGIFKIDVSVNDNFEFVFGTYGNMGFDDDPEVNELSYSTSIGNIPFTLKYNRQAEYSESEEILYSYIIPKRLRDSLTVPYIYNRTDDDVSLMTKRIRTGCILYFSKTNDVKDWVINDLAILG